MFPVWLKLKGRCCLVVGGGAVGLRKAVGLLDAGAQVTVIAPTVVPELSALAAEGRVALERRAYEKGDAGAGWALVFAATNSRPVNEQVSQDADRANVFVNVADDPELCTFNLPGRVTRGSLEVAVASGGEAPFLVRRVRQALERKIGPEWGVWVESAAGFRAAVREAGLDRAGQEACFDRFVERTLDAERPAVRVPSPAETQQWLRGNGAGAAARPVVPAPDGQAAAAAPGLVTLVGGGPGCPGLLTLLGRERLMAADAVVYDRLAAGALPTDLPAHVELHAVGKEAGHHPVPQEQINELLISLAKAGKRVVRFKGGDPYVFGRGSEEAEALDAAGLRFEVVPGVTAGVAATACAGVPVTHRREAVQVTLLTAHECAKAGGPQVRWDALAREPHATLVGYMGVTALPQVVEKLLAAGMPADMPAAVVQEGTTSRERSVVATLATLPDTVSSAGLEPPALFVIGPTVRHAGHLNWRARRPLAGQRLALAASEGQLRAGLGEAGAEIVPLPFPITPAARVVLAARPLTGCVARSSAEVEFFDDECRRPDSDGWMGWCIGREAAARAAALGWPCVELPSADVDHFLEYAARRGERAAS